MDINVEGSAPKLRRVFRQTSIRSFRPLRELMCSVLSYSISPQRRVRLSAWLQATCPDESDAITIRAGIMALLLPEEKGRQHGAKVPACPAVAFGQSGRTTGGACTLCPGCLITHIPAILGSL